MTVLHLPLKKTQYQSILLLGLVVFFIAHFTLLNPTSLEEDFSEVRAISPQELLSFFQNETVTLAKGVPTDEPPAYAIRDLEYFATDRQHQHWKMLSRKSFLYQKEQIVHARDVVFLWKEGKGTAREAVSMEEKNEVELYGNVVVTLNNGMVLNTEYAKIIVSPQNQVIIPTSYLVSGRQQVNPKTLLQFKANGLYYSEANQDLKLLSAVDAEVITRKHSQVLADQATYNQKKDLLLFEMSENQPLEKQFVKSRQDALFMKSRTLKVELEKQKLQLLTALKDVEIEDRTNTLHPVSGTAGRAIYQEATNLLFLRDFPQVYQDSDTITGDEIVYDRTKDTIEVEQSNAFNKR